MQNLLVNHTNSDTGSTIPAYVSKEDKVYKLLCNTYLSSTCYQTVMNLDTLEWLSLNFPVWLFLLALQYHRTLRFLLNDIVL